MQNLGFFVLMIIAVAAKGQTNAARVAYDVDFKQVFEQVVKAFTDCGYPDPEMGAAGGGSEEIGKLWASKIGEIIAQNKALIESK